MTVARYWRIVGIAAHDGPRISICGLHLRTPAGRVDQGVAMVSSVSPVSGVVADLASEANTAAVEFAISPGLAWSWDFGTSADREVIGVGVRAGLDMAQFLARITLQYSLDGQSWTTLSTRERYRWPGVLGWSLDEAASSRPEVTLAMPFEDGLVDISAERRVISVSGGVSIGAGRTGRAALFDGSSGYLQTPATGGLNFLGTDFTVEMWAHVPALLARAHAFTLICDATGVTVFSISLDATGLIGFTLNTGAYSTARSLAPMPLGQWVHLAGVRQGSSARLYLNGGLQQTVSVGGALLNANSPFTIGRFGNFGDGRFLAGSLEDICVSAGVARYTSDFVPQGIMPQNLEPSPIKAWQARPALMLGESISGSTVSSLGSRSVFADLQDGGLGRIYGTVSRKQTPANVPLRRRVRLFEQRSGRFIRETWSQIDGAYEFTQIKVGPEYCVIAFDHERQDFATVADGQLAEAML